MDDLVERLDTIAAMTAAMIEMGEQIAWSSSEVALMREARDHIKAQAAELARLTAKRDALLRAASTSRLAFAGYTSAQTAINELDAALGDAL